MSISSLSQNDISKDHSRSALSVRSKHSFTSNPASKFKGALVNHSKGKSANENKKKQLDITKKILRDLEGVVKDFKSLMDAINREIERAVDNAIKKLER